MSKTVKHSLTKREKEKFIRTISSGLQQNQEILAVYLFGSFVAEKPFADIDVGILTRIVPDYVLNYEIELECRLEKLLTFKMDVRILNKAPISFVQNVIRYGQVIVDSEPNRRAEFESYTLRKYFDFARFRQRYLAEVINAPI